MFESLAFAAIVFAAMLTQSCIGFAGALVAMPCISLCLTPREIIPSYSLVMLAVDILLVAESRQHVDWSKVRTLLAGGLVGMPIGAYGLKHLPAACVGLTISGVTLAFAALFMFRIVVPLRENRATQVGVGLCSGMLGGCVSASGPPVVIYALARKWEKNVFRTTLLTYFTCLAAFAVGSYLCLGMVTHRSLTLAAAGFLPAVAAAAIGLALKNRLPERHFRNVVLAVIIATSLLGLAKYMHAQVPS